MKSTGITRNLDQLGRVVVPKELRRVLGIAEGDALEIFTEGEPIILKKYQPGCMICGGMEDLKTLEGKQLCKKCLERFK